MFDKILIANRGEIAVRVARSTRRLGILSVAVYSSADRHALHVDACDEAFEIGAAAASESYLNIERIIDAAKKSGAEAIHPGYGFLSENTEFAQACADAGIVFIGPPASAIDAMGSKIDAKALMEAAGVATIPGYHGDAQDAATLATESKRIGYPQLIKASAGGGGKGMRRVDAASEFAGALASARREAKAAFGDDSVLLERYLERPRHVEIQVFADTHGKVLHLNERDCSIQRRHQKIVEEAPAPGLGDDLRARMGAAAVDCARAIDYVGAGTVEFLLDASGEFFFMEMNTRLQVEHPVTEMVTGLDLVEWQLRVAAGGALPLAQDAIGCDGHAFEARIYAEAPSRDFMPASGRIRSLELPDGEPGVRVDTGVREGDAIGTHYDPMIAKLIVHGANREAALGRLRRALRQYRILGLETNLGFLLDLVSMADFAAAEIDTGFIDRHHDALFAADTETRRLARVAAAAALLPALDDRAGQPASPWDARDHWRLNLAGVQRVLLDQGDARHELLIHALDDGWRFEHEGVSYRVVGRWLDATRMLIDVDARRLEVAVIRTDETVEIAVDGHNHRFAIPDFEHRDEGLGGDVAHATAPMTGTVVALPVAVGDTVEPGATLIVIEAMKMEHAVTARRAARVGEIRFGVGDAVDEGEILVRLEVE